MGVRRFITRDQLVDYVVSETRAVGRRGLKRALDTGKVEVLGGFSVIPPASSPGWIVRVTSVSGKEWLLSVLSVDFSIRLTLNVPWIHWAGGGSQSTLYKGDNPDLYSSLCERHRGILEKARE